MNKNDKKTLETLTPEFLENKQRLKEELFSNMEKVFNACWDDGDITAGIFILRLNGKLKKLAEEIKSKEVHNINFPSLSDLREPIEE